MIVGLGIDLVAMPRIERLLDRWGDSVVDRLLTAREKELMPGGEMAKLRRVEYVAGRVAAKEAVSKALGVPRGIHWRCAEVLPARPDPPKMELYEVARERAQALGVTRILLTLTHDGGMAAAVVILEKAT